MTRATDHYYWEEKRRELNRLHTELLGKPDNEKIGFWQTPASTLNAYREGDVSFNEAVKTIREWAIRHGATMPDVETTVIPGKVPVMIEPDEGGKRIVRVGTTSLDDPNVFIEFTRQEDGTYGSPSMAGIYIYERTNPEHIEKLSRYVAKAAQIMRDGYTWVETGEG